jgi:C-terminal processing protease CtpA/Prc
MDARLVPGDVIIAVDGQQLETLQMAKDLVIGAEGTPVVIEV